MYPKHIVTGTSCQLVRKLWLIWYLGFCIAPVVAGRGEYHALGNVTGVKGDLAHCLVITWYQLLLHNKSPPNLFLDSMDCQFGLGSTGCFIYWSLYDLTHMAAQLDHLRTRHLGAVGSRCGFLTHMSDGCLWECGLLGLVCSASSSSPRFLHLLKMSQKQQKKTSPNEQALFEFSLVLH